MRFLLNLFNIKIFFINILFFFYFSILSCDPKHNPKKNQRLIADIDDPDFKKKLSKYLFGTGNETEFDKELGEEKKVSEIKRAFRSPLVKWLLGQIHKEEFRAIPENMKLIHKELDDRLNRQMNKSDLKTLSELGNVDLRQDEFDEGKELLREISKQIIIDKAKASPDLTEEDFEKLIKEYEYINSKDKDALETLTKMLKALVKEDISLREILVGDKKIIDKLANLPKDKKEYDIARTIGKHYDDYKERLPSLIKLLIARILGESGLGRNITKSEKTFVYQKQSKFVPYKQGPDGKYLDYKGESTGLYLSENLYKIAKKERLEKNSYISISNEQVVWFGDQLGFDENNSISAIMGEKNYNKRKALNWLKDSLPYQRFSKREKNCARKIKIFDNKQCGLQAFLKSLIAAYNINSDKLLVFKFDFIKEIANYYTGATNEIYLEDYLSSLIFGVDKFNKLHSEVYKRTITSMSPLIKAILEKGPLQEVGLLPEDMVTAFRSYGAKCFAYNTFAEVERKMLECLQKGLVPYPLVYWESGGMHYFPLIHNQDNKYYIDDSDAIIKELDPKKRTALKYLMKFKKESILKKLKEKNVNDKIVVFLGKGNENDLLKNIMKMIKGKTGGNNPQTDNGIKFCFIVADPYNLLKDKGIF